LTGDIKLLFGVYCGCIAGVERCWMGFYVILFRV